MTYIARSLSLAALALMLTGAGVADTVEVTGRVINQGPEDYNGSFTLFFDVDRTLLPAVYDPINHLGQVPITNVSAAIEYQNGTSNEGTGGTGTIDPIAANGSYLNFSAGDIGGIFNVPAAYDGTQSLPDIINANVSFLQSGGHNGYFEGGTSILVDTPEPTTSSLAGLAFTALGWFGIRSRRKAKLA